MGIWRKVFLLSGAAGERWKTVPDFVGGERKFVRCKDRTGNLNREYLHQNEKELGIILK